MRSPELFLRDEWLPLFLLFAFTNVLEIVGVGFSTSTCGQNSLVQIGHCQNDGFFMLSGTISVSQILQFTDFKITVVSIHTPPINGGGSLRLPARPFITVRWYNLYQLATAFPADFLFCGAKTGFSALFAFIFLHCNLLKRVLRFLESGYLAFQDVVPPSAWPRRYSKARPANVVHPSYPANISTDAEYRCQSGYESGCLY